MGIERRNFIRHPLSYPVTTKVISEQARAPVMVSQSENIGAGGILFSYERELAEGTGVEIGLQVEHRRFTLDGKVVRVERTNDGKFNIAVAFNAPSEILKVRMMEQIVRIELFKNRLERRFKAKLDFGAVAKEWIRRYSKLFAERYDI